MFQLSFTKKRLYMILAMVLLAYFAYQLSFKHTLAAIALHGELEKNKLTGNEVDGSYGQLERKNNFYQAALKAYRVKADDRENRLWQEISGLAISRNLVISFSPNPANADSTVRNAVKQQFIFKGNYANIVKLLDTVSSTKGIGKISSIQILTMKNELASSGQNQLTMSLTLVGLVR